MADIEPKMVEVSPDDAIAYVLSLNLYRRHLSTTQRGMVAARARDYYNKQAKERQRASGGDQKKKAVVENLPQPDHNRARDAAGKALGVSGKTVHGDV